jgi:hypothetical protein
MACNSAYNIFAAKVKGKRPYGRSRHKWKDNIKMYLEEIVCDGVS